MTKKVENSDNFLHHKNKNHEAETSEQILLSLFFVLVSIDDLLFFN